MTWDEVSENLTEQWKPVEGWPKYEISDQGRLRSWHKSPNESGHPQIPRILKGGYNRYGYRRAVLVGPEGQRRSFLIYHLVADAFIGARPKGLVLTHLNGINTDDRSQNLKYRTQKENIHDKIKHGTMPYGERHHMAKLTAKEVLEIRQSPEPNKILTKKYNITSSHVSSIKYGRIWKHLAKK